MPALAMLLLLGACASAPPPKPSEQTPLVWPDVAGEPARVAFVRAFSRPEEIGIEKGFMQRLAEFVLGPTDARLVRPMAVVAKGGIVFVADPGAKGVHRFDIQGGRYDLIGAEGDLPLPSPVGLAVGAEGEVYVTDSALPAVLVIRSGAKVAVPVPLPKMGQPTGVAFDSGGGRLFVTDTAAHRVNVFGRDGALQGSLGGRGDGDGEFNFPTYVWRDSDGRLYVTDSLNFRIQVFGDDGRFVGKFGRPGDGVGDFMRQKGVATDSFGHVYIVDALASALLIHDKLGRLLLSIGNLGQDRGEFWLPAGVFIGEDDQIYVADAYNGRVQVFRYIGGPT